MVIASGYSSCCGDSATGSSAARRLMSTTAPYDCERCHAGMRPDDLRCPACGTPRPGVDLPEIPATSGAAARRGMIDNPYAVLAAVFLAMMALGIPLIWACRAWTPATKALLTVLTLAYTALVFWLFYLAMAWSWNRISPLL